METLSTADPRTYLTALGIAYVEKSGQLVASCPNPAHEDSNPSWNMSLQYPYPHHCFSCGFSGTLATLVKFLGNSTQKENIKRLEQEEFFMTNTPARQDDSAERRVVSVEGNQYDPRDFPESYDYVTRRHMGAEFINTYGITYLPNGTVNGTRFYRRLCIPVVEGGTLISMEGRTVTPGIKPKVIYPKKSRVNTLFNIDNLDRHAPLYVVEGVADLSQLFNAGLRNITSTFGSGVTPRQIKLLNEFRDIVLVPDQDAGGKEFVVTVDTGYHREFRIMELPAHRKDPGDCTLREIYHSLRNYIVPAATYLLKINDLHYKGAAATASTSSEGVL